MIREDAQTDMPCPRYPFEMFAKQHMRAVHNAFKNARGVQITVRAILEAMKITKVDEYRREVSEAKYSHIEELVNDTQLSNTASDRQKSATIK